MFFDNDYTGSAANTFYYVIYTTDRGELETDVGLYRAGSYYDPLFSAECEGDTFLGWFTEDGVALTDDYFRTMYGIMKNNNNGTAKRY